MNDLTPQQWKDGLMIMAEKTVTIPIGAKVVRWDRETRIILVYSVLCALARNQGVPI